MDISKFEIQNGEYFYDGEKLYPRKNSQGYLYVYICSKNYRLHRLIALRYIKNPNNLKIVGHKDDIKTNNEPYNLYWTTAKENMKKAFKSNISMKRMHKGKRPVIATKDNLTINFQSVRQASRILKRDVAAVVRCCQGEWGKCNGFKLKYKD